MWWLFALLSAIFASLVTILGKLGLKNIDSTLATTVRASIMAIYLIIFSLITKKFSANNFSNFEARDWVLICLSGLAGAASWLVYFLALKTGLASHVSAIDRTSLLFIIILSAFFLGESVSWKMVIGGLLIIGGTILITFK